MQVKVNKIGSVGKNKFADVLIKEHEKRAKAVGDMIGRNATKHLRKVTDNTVRGFKGAKPKYKVKITKSKRQGVTVNVHVWVASGKTNAPHYIFHRVEAGVREQFQKDTRYFIPSGQPSTFKGTFSRGRKNYNIGQWRFGRSGKTYSFEGRQWYNLTVDRMKTNNFGSIRQIEKAGWKFDNISIYNGRQSFVES